MLQNLEKRGIFNEMLRNLGLLNMVQVFIALETMEISYKCLCSMKS